MNNLFASTYYLNTQADTIRVPSDSLPNIGNLNVSFNQVVKSGNLSNTVFMLEPSGYYVLSDSLLVPAGEHLTIVAPEPGMTQSSAPPQILSATGVNQYFSKIRFTIVCYGDLTLKNIWLLGANTSGWQVGTCIVFLDDPKNSQPQKCNMEGVIIDYSPVTTLAGGSITVASKNFSGFFKNCYWKNCTDPHFRYYGRAVSFPYGTTGHHIDSLYFENCTFANIGYVYMQELGNYADYVSFNHCTFFNVVMFSLQSGWWHNLALTNSIFVNPYMYGYMPLYVSNNGIEPNGATIRIDSVATFDFNVPFNEEDRKILFANISCYYETWLVDWMKYNPYSIILRNTNQLDRIPQPQPIFNDKTKSFFESVENGTKVFPYINKANIYDSVNPDFVLAPTDTIALKSFLYHRWFDSADSSWAWKPENSINRLWPLEESLAYRNESLLVGGMNAFPLGDLYRWFPEKYTTWKNQKENEDKRISTWLNTGKDPFLVSVNNRSNLELPINYALFQNYPNPFNPETNISFQIPTDGNVSIKIYDVLGRLVSVPVNEYKKAGKYSIVFNFSQAIGKHKLSSGIYFLTLRSGNFVDTKKMILIK